MRFMVASVAIHGALVFPLTLVVAPPELQPSALSVSMVSKAALEALSTPQAQDLAPDALEAADLAETAVEAAASSAPAAQDRLSDSGGDAQDAAPRALAAALGATTTDPAPAARAQPATAAEASAAGAAPSPDRYTSSAVPTYQDGIDIEAAARERRIAGSVHRERPTDIADIEALELHDVAGLRGWPGPHWHTHSERALERVTGAARPAQRPEQDRDSLVSMIQDRAQSLVPLVAPDEAVGKTRVRVILDRHGYVDGFEVSRSSGHALLDRVSEQVMHLGEPYRYVPGWFELELVFYQ